MDKEHLKYLAVNRDAVAVNRGFYYQYLTVLEKWITHFINGDDDQVFTEVDDDIKEVGGNLIFTQVKCYTSNFSLNSVEIKKMFLNFFTLFLEEKENVPGIRFNFETNSGIATRDKLLRNWVDSQPLVKGEFESACAKRTREILSQELKKSRDRWLARSGSDKQRKITVKTAYAAIFEEVDNANTVNQFIRQINWTFLDKPPELGVDKLDKRIRQMLKHEKFFDRPISILMEALLSAIYRRSQLTDKGLRVLDQHLMQSILTATDEQLSMTVNRKLTNLLDGRFSTVFESIAAIQEVQLQHDVRIKNLEDQTKPLENNNLLPHDITFLPTAHSVSRIDRFHEIYGLHDSLIEHRNVAVTGNAGMGKSIVVRLYLEHFSQLYRHVIWISVEGDLRQALVYNEELLDNLQIQFAKTDDEEKRFRMIVKRIGAIEGNNIIVLDNISDLNGLERIRACRNWKIVLTTRSRPTIVFNWALPELDFTAAKSLYKLCHPAGDSDDLLLRAFEMIGFNTLLISLIAQTIDRSVDLTLNRFMELFENQQLDDLELEIDVELPLSENTSDARLFGYVQAIFDQSALDSEEHHFLEFFSLLPAENIVIDDLVDWCGKDYEKSNKITFTNVVNQLHRKGLVERNGNKFSMHKMLQESIIYKSRKEQSAFMGQLFFLSWLSRRFQEGVEGDQQQAFRFLRYGESILHAIKEPYRIAVYQPLLVLENEVLNAYNWKIVEGRLDRRWEDLLRRAGSFLSNEDSLLGIINNNYGLALAEQQQLEWAEVHLNKAIAILSPHAEKSLTQLLYAIFNLMRVLIEKGDIGGFKSWLDKSMYLRKKHKIFNDPSLPIQCNMLGIVNQNFRNYAAATQMFNIAINLHLEIEKNKRNDLLLVLYMNNLAYNYFCNGEKEMAHQVVNNAVRTLKSLEIRDSKMNEILLFTLLSMGVDMDSEKDI